MDIHTGLQTSSRSNLPAVLLACRLARQLTCLPAHWQTGKPSNRLIRQQKSLNTIEEQYEFKRGCSATDFSSPR